VVLAGISNGAGFAEHMARHGLLPLAGLFLVSGTIREASRQAAPVPAQRTAVTLMAGTADPMAPYQGGALRARGVIGRVLRRRAARHGDLPSQRRIVPVETVARDWAAGTAGPAARSTCRPASSVRSPGTSTRAKSCLIW
jgi:poly(3-hydroxybutyrate) depolymerase